MPSFFPPSFCLKSPVPNFFPCKTKFSFFVPLNMSPATATSSLVFTSTNIFLLLVGVYVGRISIEFPVEYKSWIELGEKDCADNDRNAVELYLTAIAGAPIAMMEFVFMILPPLLPLILAVHLAAVAVGSTQGLSRGRGTTSASILPYLRVAICGAVVVVASWAGFPAIQFLLFGFQSVGSNKNCLELKQISKSFFVVHSIGFCSWLLLLAVLWSSKAAAASNSTFTLGRGVSTARGSVRGLTDRAIREHSKLHTFLYGSGSGGREDDENDASEVGLESGTRGDASKDTGTNESTLPHDGDHTDDLGHVARDFDIRDK